MPKQQFKDADDMMAEMTSFMGEAKEMARIRTVWTSMMPKMLKLLLQTPVAKKRSVCVCVCVVSCVGCVRKRMLL